MFCSTLSILILQIFATSTVLTATTPIYFSSSSSPSTLSSDSTSFSKVISPKSGTVYNNKLDNAILNFDFPMIAESNSGSSSSSGEGGYEIESLDLSLVMWKRRTGGQIHSPGNDIILAENLIPNSSTKAIKLSYSLKGICGSYELIRIEHRLSSSSTGENLRSVVRVPGIYLLVDCNLD